MLMGKKKDFIFIVLILNYTYHNLIILPYSNVIQVNTFKPLRHEGVWGNIF